MTILFVLINYFDIENPHLSQITLFLFHPYFQAPFLGTHYYQETGLSITHSFEP